MALAGDVDRRARGRAADRAQERRDQQWIPRLGPPRSHWLFIVSASPHDPRHLTYSPIGPISPDKSKPVRSLPQRRALVGGGRETLDNKCLALLIGQTTISRHATPFRPFDHILASASLHLWPVDSTRGFGAGAATARWNPSAARSQSGLRARRGRRVDWPGEKPAGPLLPI